MTLWVAAALLAEQPPITRIDPPHWWVGMGYDTVELLVEGANLGTSPIRVQGMGVTLADDRSATNSRYRYVTIAVSADAPAQNIRIYTEGSADTTRYELRHRKTGHSKIGLDPSDMMYLIMVDRFANGDTGNDAVATMREKRVDRSAPYGRHGGDLTGVREHIGYLDSLGITAVWMCPVLENDQPRSSYHGYAITDHYAIDPRIGTVDDYRKVSDALHQRSMRLVVDVVLNHTGDEHRLFRQPPDSAWFNWWPEYTQTSGRENTNFDPYATDQDKRRFRQGWFDRSMPDLNTADAHVARYLVQNTIWWIEEADVDALRVDTYTYPDQAFMNTWTATIRKVFPGIFIFGETWVDSHPSQAYYLEKFPFNPDSHLQSTTDFQLYTALRDVLTQQSGWDSGTGRLYRTLAADYLYASPDRQVTFLDNHDLPRIAGVVNRNTQKLKMGLALLLTLRGIPCITYGTECGFAATSDHGSIREDMPGGWPGDSHSFGRNAFATDNDVAQWLRSLLTFRRSSPAMSTGVMHHITPQNGLYAVMRSTDSETILCIINADDSERTLDVGRLDDVLKGQRDAIEIPLMNPVRITHHITMQPFTTQILSFRH
ncbi:MAG: alpha-amylase family glycosyl hydrolase [Candidatus Kapaibacterium sp.]